MSLANHVVDNLSAYLDDELSAAERARVATHLRGCAQCQRDLDSLRYTVRMTQTLPPLRAPRAFTLSDEQAARAHPRSPLGWVTNALRGMTVVATLLFLVVVSADLFALNQLSGPTSASVPAAMRPAASGAAESSPSGANNQTSAAPAPPAQPAAPTNAPSAMSQQPAQTATARPTGVGNLSSRETPATADTMRAPAATTTPTAKSATTPAPPATPSDAGRTAATPTVTPQPPATSDARAQSGETGAIALSPLRLVELGLLAFVALGVVALVIMRAVGRG